MLCSFSASLHQGSLQCSSYCTRHGGCSYDAPQLQETPGSQVGPPDWFGWGGDAACRKYERRMASMSDVRFFFHSSNRVTANAYKTMKTLAVLIM